MKALLDAMQFKQIMDGCKHAAVDIVAQDVEFLTPRQSDSGNDDTGYRSGGKPALQEFDDDGDIPF